MSDPTSGTWFGDSGKPLYRHVLVNHGDEDFSEHMQNVFAGLKRGTHAQVAHKLMEHIDKPREHAFDSRVGVRVGSHWTHDFDQVQHYSDYSDHGPGSTSAVLEAHHPGYEHVMRWEHPKDSETLSRIVVPAHQKEGAQLEVPIRPGTPMNISALHVRGANAADRYAPDDLIRIGMNRRTNA
jgi:hypothetical protein